MEVDLLTPTHPTRDFHPENFRVGYDRKAASSQLPDIVEESSYGGEKVYVAVGKSAEKGVSLLQWSFKQFKSREICVLHIHQPSLFIPYPLGKLPANQANAEAVLAHRTHEREQMQKLLQHYLAICRRAKVKASIVITECDQVQNGLLDLVNKHGVRTLVIGAVPENCKKAKKSSNKASFVARSAPPFCEIWFVKRGKHVWTRETSGRSNLAEEATSGTPRSKSFRYIKSIASAHQDDVQSSSGLGITSARVSNWVQSDSNGAEADSSSLCSQLEEAEKQAEALRGVALDELLRRKKLEFQALEAIRKVKVYESGYANELKLRKQADDALRDTIQHQEKLLEQREQISNELQRTMRSIAILDNRTKETNHRQHETSKEIKLIQASIATLRHEKQRIRKQKMEAAHWLERWRNCRRVESPNCNEFLGFAEELPELAEFSLSDLKTATCNFSESFKLGEGGFGCVYKGEMLGRTVAIKKLHPHSVQSQSEFQKEVQILGKLQHPHLVTLLGFCPEAWSLVYEYLPNGSLHDCLSFRRGNVLPLTWKIRARNIVQIASALCFLHSSKPEKIVHGDLKPQNILLDSELSCKICEFGICRLVIDESPYSPSFRRGTELKGALSYTDPEFHRVGVLTTKSDVYSFGVIILQMLTGRPPVGLVGDVSRAISSNKLGSILDPSAGEWPAVVARRLAELALQFCELRGRDRPELTPALVRELEQLHVSEERPVPSFFLCPILQEIMQDPQVAADGFTYEGEALREWFEKGHVTSPMTNLKLDDLNLTPNHALRLAIQHWLCQS